MIRKPLVIRNDADLSAALKRAQELSSGAGRAEDERELATITAAIEVYTNAMSVLRQVGENGEPNPRDTQLLGQE